MRWFTLLCLAALVDASCPYPALLGRTGSQRKGGEVAASSDTCWREVALPKRRQRGRMACDGTGWQANGVAVWRGGGFN